MIARLGCLYFRMPREVAEVRQNVADVLEVGVGRVAEFAEALSMGKRTKKLLVYLDQNFLSEMSKAGVNMRVRPEFKEIYELLHQDFVDEKLVVPQSLLHDIESSFATHLK